MPRGRLPTVIVATTLLVCGEMTESVLATSLLTYSAGPAERAGRVSPIASRKGRAWVRLGDIAGFMRVYPIQSLKMAWSRCSAWSSPRRRSRPRIRLRIAPVKSAPVTSVGQVGAGEVCPGEQHLPQVRPGEVGVREIGRRGVRPQ